MVKNLHIKLGKAVYDKAVHDQNSKEVFDNLQMLNDLFKDLEIVSLFNNLAFAKQNLIERTIMEAFEHPLEETIFDLMILLIQNHQVQLLPKIFAAFRRHRFEQLGIREVKIRTARSLTPAEKTAISDKLGGKTGKLHITFQHQEDLIGGMQIYDQGRLTDYSLRNYLDHLQSHLNNLEI
jgi:F-type H+-transporting ATPase subunit delta